MPLAPGGGWRDHGAVFEGEAPVLILKFERRFAASPDVVFAVMQDDDNFFFLRPDAVEHCDIVVEPTGGHSCTQVYEKNGQRIRQYNRNIDYLPGKKTVDEVESEIGGRTRSTVTFEPLHDGTRVKVHREVFGSRRPSWGARRRYRKSAQISLDEFFDRVEQLINQSPT